ncbi:DUF4432 family protein [Shimia sp.]|uniref:DUF4432 family protein n=1 Tax=Shimia sp. TaxID=1954381 RepID=UPI0032979E87
MIDATNQNQDPVFLRSVYSSPDAYASARLATLGDGAERGVRVVEFRTALGLEAEITIDRGGDVGRLALNGKTLSWHAPHGLRAPWLLNLENDNGQGFLRGIGGFLKTCGLAHIRQPETDHPDNASVPLPHDTYYPLHGNSTFDPAWLVGYGLNDDADEPYLWCEIERIESVATRNALRLRRKFSAPIWGRTISIQDDVVNIGHRSVSQMTLYHFHVGYPLVAPGTTIDVTGGSKVWTSRPHDPLAPYSEPHETSFNDISTYKLSGNRATVTISEQEKNHGLALSFDTVNLPYVQLLRMTSPGLYGIAIEPCTTRARTRKSAREIGEMSILEPGESRHYDLGITVFNNNSSER